MTDISLLLNLLKEFAWLGNWFFFILAFIESAPFVGVIIPGASLISVGGFLAYQGFLNTWDIIIYSTLGAIFGDFFSYLLGRFGGNLIKNKKEKNYSLIRHGEDFFEQYGNKSVFLGRFFGPIRAIIPFIAGLSKMKYKPFIFWNIISAICWAFLNVFLGYFSGTIIVTIFKKWSSSLSLILFIILIILATYWIIKKKNKSIKHSFQASSYNFIQKLYTYNWFNKLNNRYIFIGTFFRESKHATEKIFGSVLVLSFLIIVYILIIILDIF